MLLIATPVRCSEPLAATVTVGYSCASRALACQMPTVFLQVFGLDVVRARNRVVGQLLRDPTYADVTHVLWWDDDQWPEDVRIVGKMMALGEDVVGAAYTNKRSPTRYVHQPWPGSSGPDERGLYDVRGVGMGFTLTSRACLETMARGAEWYWDLPEPRECPNIFGQLIDEFDSRRVLLSEDFSFCKRWREDYDGKIKIYTKAGIVYHAGAHAWSAREIPGRTIG